MTTIANTQLDRPSQLVQVDNSPCVYAPEFDTLSPDQQSEMERVIDKLLQSITNRLNQTEERISWPWLLVDKDFIDSWAKDKEDFDSSIGEMADIFIRRARTTYMASHGGRAAMEEKRVRGVAARETLSQPRRFKEDRFRKALGQTQQRRNRQIFTVND